MSRAERAQSTRDGCAPGCDFPVTGYHARRGGRVLCEVAQPNRSRLVADEFARAVKRAEALPSYARPVVTR